MAIIYGSGFKPMKLSIGDVKTKKEKLKESTWEHALEVSLNIISAISFIALSFIPVVGEAVAATAIAEEATSLTVEAAAESIIAGTEIAQVASSTAQTVRLGSTLKGAIGLGIAEASANTAQDAAFGHLNIVNEAINWGLSFTPLLGFKKGRSFAKARLFNRAEEKIQSLSKLLVDSIGEERSMIEQRIRELKNIKYIRSSKGIYSGEIASVDFQSAKNEMNRILNAGEEGTFTVKSLSKELRNNLNKSNIIFSKNEIKKIVRVATKKNLSVSEGLTIKGITESRIYSRALNLMRWADPSLATRKVFTGAAAFLSSDKNLLIKQFSKKTGKYHYKLLSRVAENSKSRIIIGGSKINLGLYKKFGKKISEFWRSWGKKIYKSSAMHMIPVLSSWIDGYRMIPSAVPGEYTLIIIFKPSNNGNIPEPRVIFPVPINKILEFEAGEGYHGSSGSFYINEFALARNGARSTFLGIASILGPIPLGELRNILALPSAFERIVRKFTQQNFFDNYFDYITETSNRLWTHKIGKVLAGRWGISIARGFQQKKHGHTINTFTPDAGFDWRHIVEEIGVVTLDKGRSVQRKAGIMGRTNIIGTKRIKGQWQRAVKNATFGYVKYDGKKGFKKGNGIF